MRALTMDHWIIKCVLYQPRYHPQTLLVLSEVHTMEATNKSGIRGVMFYLEIYHHLAIM